MKMLFLNLLCRVSIACFVNCPALRNGKLSFYPRRVIYLKEDTIRSNIIFLVANAMVQSSRYKDHMLVRLRILQIRSIPRTLCRYLPESEK